MLDTSRATVHSVERAKERIGLNEKNAHRKINLAMERGKDFTHFSSSESNYLKKASKDGCTAIAYDNFCYIINSEGFCVTVTPLPRWFEKKKRYDGKTSIRNLKQYINNYNYFSDEATYYI